MRSEQIATNAAPEAVRAGIHAAVSRGAREILLAGSDAARGDLAALVALAHSTAERVVLETNAADLDDAQARALAAAGLDLARVPVVAWGDESDVLTRAPGFFRASLAGMESLWRAGIALELHAPIVRENLLLLSAIPAGVAASGLRVQALVLRVPLQGDPSRVATIEEAGAAIHAVALAGRGANVTVRMDESHYLPPCLFDRPHRIAHLFALNRGNVERPRYKHVGACDSCIAKDRCPGLPDALLARGPVSPQPIQEERTRRRLTVISTVEEQIRRELVAKEMTRPGGVGEAIPAHTVRINFHCNQSCHFCFVSTHLPAPDDKDVRAAIVEAGRAGGVLALSGGEPTLNPRLAEYVRLGKQEGAKTVELQTNATRLANPELVRELEEAGLDTAMISLHGSTAAISDHVTDAPGTFEPTVLGIDALAKSRIQLRLNFVFCEWNRSDFPAYVRLVAARWPQAIIIVSFVSSHTDIVPRTRAMIPRFSDVLPSLVEGLSIASAAGLTVSGFESMCGIPLCVMGAEHRQLFEMSALPDGIDGGEFLKTDTCTRCALSSRCYGVRRGYAELHGTDELVAIPA